jgi:hypothetical protein
MNTPTLPQRTVVVNPAIACEMEAQLARLKVVFSPEDQAAFLRVLEETRAQVTDAQRVLALRCAIICQNVDEGIHNLRVWAEGGDPSNCYDARHAGETRDNPAARSGFGGWTD